MRFLVSLTAVAALFVAGAQTARAGDTTDVARLSAIAGGSVTIERGDDKTQVAGTVNAPLLPGDLIATDATAKAEVQLDGFTMLRLAGGTQIRIANNDATLREVQLAAGTVELALVHDQSGSVQIDTPSIALRATHTGEYRIAVTPSGTRALARSGVAEIVAGTESYDLRPGKTFEASGSADNPSITYGPVVGLDDLDAFSAERDRHVDAALNTDTYVPAGIAGYDDLDSYGRWVNVASYGMVWTPYVSAAWVPYRYGSWVWEDGFAWTWVAYEPWGWVPFHYGRWFYCQPYGWCWYPPPLGVVPVWYPALVGFFGYGDYSNVMLGFDYWGWVPLWPNEPFYPWYGGWGVWHSHPHPPFPPPPPPRRHLPPIRMHPDTPGVLAYRNARYGATGIDGTSLRKGEFSKTVPIDARQLGSVTVLRGILPLTPTAANLSFAPQLPVTHVRFQPAFAQPHFSTARDLPLRTQFNNQQQQLRQTLHEQRNNPPLPPRQVPGATDVWNRFEQMRRNAPEPPVSAPQPHQYPITQPVHLPPEIPAPPPAQSRPPGGTAPHRPPVAIDWQSVVTDYQPQ